MPVADDVLHRLAASLREAERTGVPRGPLSSDHPDLSIPDAYRIQRVTIDQKVSDGEQITGKKIGLTSQAMQDLLGVGQPDYGHLLTSMEVEGNRTDVASLVQPRVEAEIAFVLARDLPMSGVTSAQVIDATGHVVAALEIVDSRVADWKITIVDTVADNASSGRYVLGDRRVDPRSIELPAVAMRFTRNGA
ncbi:MAG: 2-keto-4-pentenoate hydratase, partial [Propioniciclava sp.]